MIWLFIDRSERARRVDQIIKLLRKEKHEINVAYLELLKKFLQKQENIDVGLVAEFEKLKQKLDRLDFETHIELESVVNELNGGHATEALRRLAKIIEQKLKKKVDSDRNFTGRKMLHNLLNHAKNKNWITVGQHENLMLLKDIRNKESHELVVTQDSRKVGLCAYAGIDLLYSL